MVIHKAGHRISSFHHAETHRSPNTRSVAAHQRQAGHADASMFDRTAPRSAANTTCVPNDLADQEINPAPAPTAANELAAQALRVKGAMPRPSNPGPDASLEMRGRYEQQTQRYDRQQSLANQVISLTKGLPNPLPAGLVAPKLPGPDATAQQSAQFQADLLKFVAAAKSGNTAPNAGTDLANQAVRMIGAMTEPAMPGPNSTHQQLAQYDRDCQRYDQLKNLADQVIAQTAGLPSPLPAGVVAPQLPGPDATPQQQAQFQADLLKFVAAAKNGRSSTSSAATSSPTTSSVPAATTASTSPTTSSSPSTGAGRDVADDAIRAIGALKEPVIPGPDATPQELAQYEKDTKKYDRMMELMSSIIKKRDELQMSLIRKM